MPKHWTIKKCTATFSKHFLSSRACCKSALFKCQLGQHTSQTRFKRTSRLLLLFLCCCFCCWGMSTQPCYCYLAFQSLYKKNNNSQKIENSKNSRSLVIHTFISFSNLKSHSSYMAHYCHHLHVGLQVISQSIGYFSHMTTTFQPITQHLHTALGGSASAYLYNQLSLGSMYFYLLTYFKTDFWN